VRLLEQSQTPEDASARVAELRQLTARALGEVRRIALELRPAVLDDLGLTDAVSVYVGDLNASAAGRRRAALEVRDDGGGFDVRTGPGSAGLGLAGMRERMALSPA
jgi:signal transduction histidine kinase